MRPFLSTAVASIITRPAPDIARFMRCCRCQAEAHPSCAEYWHMGATTILFGRSTGPSSIGEKSEGGLDIVDSETDAASTLSEKAALRTWHGILICSRYGC